MSLDIFDSFLRVCTELQLCCYPKLSGLSYSELYDITLHSKTKGISLLNCSFRIVNDDETKQIVPNTVNYILKCSTTAQLVDVKYV